MINQEISGNVPANQVALVTGGGRGIGREIARQLGDAGVLVVLAGRSQPDLTAAAEDLRGGGAEVDTITLDITNTSSIARATATLEHRYGRIDILVNNAAIRIEKYGLTPSEQPLDKWRETFETNLFGTIALTQSLLPLVRRARAGRIVNVSSLLGSIGTHTDCTSYAYTPFFKSLPAYSASKCALNSWTVHLAFELRDTAIKVNSVHPGYTRTSMNDGAGEQDPPDGAKASVRMALLPADGPSGTFTHLDTTLPW
ncbi:MAG: short-chain dehydrogenase [Thalassobius sp.]|nr:short-chain dehydrogenase [Thalassovita sp.]